MKPCDAIQEKLVAAESLAADQLAHLETCQDCRGFRATIETIASTSEPVVALSEPKAAEVSAVQETMARRIHPPRMGFRLAWAGAAMALGVLLVIAVLSNTFGPDNLEQSEERLVTLLDEVSDIADPYEDTVGEDEELYLAEVLLEDSAKIDTELQMPETYQLLEQALQNDWL